MQLSRRRAPAVQAAVSSAMAPASGLPASVSTGGLATAGAAGSGSAGVAAVVEERLLAYAPHYLASLQQGSGAEERHGRLTGAATHIGGDADHAAEGGATVSRSRDAATLKFLSQRSRAKTTQALLLVCLHIGSDPPDYPRVEPCAKLECWLDPFVARYAPKGSSETITEQLEAQYRTLHKEVMYRKCVEANVEDARQYLLSTRRKARDGRTLMHYNGHGMPRATSLGEIWFFDKDRTHYVPLNISEMSQLLDSPSLYVLDCNSAGSILQHWYQEGLHEVRCNDMFICACSAGEFLPLNPLLPADLLTACLTTPLRMALEWYISFSHRSVLLPHVTDEMIRSIPGDIADRKSPLGELNWILIAVTHTIAWSTTSPELFYQLFRQDMLVKALFRNFFLADRIMREAGCTPTSYPPISEAASVHHLWNVWEIALERVVCQLPKMLNADMSVNPTYTYVPSTFFTDQLAAFEVWVETGDPHDLPEQLPCVLLALTQILYRLPALTLLSRYLDTSGEAVKRAVLCGLLPYLSKLLVQTPEVLLIVCCMWMQVVRGDPKTGCAELAKCQADKHFIRVLGIDGAILKISSTSQTVGGMTTRWGSDVSLDDARSPCTNLSAVRRFPGGPSALDTIADPEHARGVQPMQPLAGAAAKGLPFGNVTGPADDRDDGATVKLGLPNQPMLRQRPRGAGRTSSATRKAEPGRADGAGQAASPQLQPVLTGTAGDSYRVLRDEGKEETEDSVNYYVLQNVGLSRCKAMSCYILVQMMDEGGERQCISMWNSQLLRVAFAQLSASSDELRSWACLLLAKLFACLRHAKEFACKEYSARIDLFTSHLNDRSPIVRSSCVTLLATLLGARIDTLPHDVQIRRTQMEKTLLIRLREYLFDPSMAVRHELIFAACQILHRYAPLQSGCQQWEHIAQHQGKEWMLNEPEVQVKSQLHAGRPTVSIRFDDSVVFNTVFISHDDPRPPAEWDASKVSDIAMETIRGLVHDASLMLVTMHANCDAQRVKQAAESLVRGAPESTRFADEGLRTMRNVVSDESQHTLSEADRARKTRNSDSMGKLVLDLHERHFEPPFSGGRSSVPQVPTASGIGSSILTFFGSVSESSGVGGGSSAVPGAGKRSSTATEMASRRFQMLTGGVPGNHVVCSVFRLLEPETFVGDVNQGISLVSYGDFASQSVVRSHKHRGQWPLHDLLLVNDLSESYGVLAVDVNGSFTLYRGSSWGPQASNTSTLYEVARFSACPPRGAINLRCAYRARDGVLLYGGPIGSTPFSTELHLLSMEEEQVIQKIPISGNAQLTSLSVNSVANAVFAGTSDGVVRYYDDRQRQGQLATVSMLQRRGASAEAVLGVAALEGAALHVASATRSFVTIFDVRRPVEPVVSLEAASIRTPSDSNGTPVAHSAPTIACFSASLHAPLMMIGFHDGTFDILSRRGVSVLDHHPRSTRLDMRSATRANWGTMHPIRPIALVAGDIAVLN